MALRCPNCLYENPEGSPVCRRCGSPLEKPGPRDGADGWAVTLEMPPDDLEPGTLFARRYQVIEKVGEGGMGKVYKVLDREIETIVALKLIRPEIASDKRTIERFRNELKTARKISHRNVSRMFDLDIENGTYYITMEYVPGEDLKSMIEMTRGLSVTTAVDIARQVCEGLAEAHRAKVVHRDVKPGNIVIDKSGNAKIMDFGLAWSADEERRTNQGGMAGTPAYMSPEQVEGEAVDPRSDIYSLGVILFEMLTGRLPFQAANALDMVLKHQTEIPPDPKSLSPDIPDELSRIVLRCLEKDKNKRVRTAEELLTALDEIGRGLTRSRDAERRETAAGPAGRMPRPWIRRSVPAVILAVLAGMFFAFRSLIPRKPSFSAAKSMLAVLPFANLGAPEDEYFADGITEEVTSRLAALKGLGIISRTSAVQYKQTTKTIKQIGEELGVDYVLEGTVRWDRSAPGAGRVRITPQLIRTSDDTHIWAGRYDRVLEDIFSVQSEIAEQVTKQLDIIVLEPERKALRARPTENLEAYDCYFRALQYFTSAYLTQERDAYDKTIAQFEKAIRLDPGFFYAYYNLQNVHSLMYNVGLDRTEGRLSKCREAIDNLVRLAPDSPETRQALAAYAATADRDYERALVIYESVYRERPNMPPASVAGIQMRQGKWREAIANYEKSFTLNPRSHEFAHVLGRLYAWIGKYEDSEAWFDRALSIFPGLYYSRLGKARLPLLSRGDLAETRSRLATLMPHRLTEYNWFFLCLYERNYREALSRLDSSSHEFFSEAQFYIPLDLACATAHYYLNETVQMRKRADSARILLEKASFENPGDARYHAALGLAYAYLGRREDAVKEGRTALEIYPLAQDAFEGPRHILNMASIYAVTGDRDKALDELESLFSIPCGNNYSLAILRIDPQWDSVRGDPRFRRLLERPGFTASSGD
ncbi:MAG: protein kinase [Acidobacteriota bacterium]|nr:protein kinase [Acidobacteriota bacterium]